MSQANPSITFLIATSGRKTLRDTVRSLYGQFNHGIDKIEVFFDGPPVEVGPNYFYAEEQLYNGDLTLHQLPDNLGYWGHAIRNKFQKTFKTDYVHHGDDDDQYAEAVMFRVRNDLRDNFGKLLLYKFRNSDGIVWTRPEFYFGNLGTPSGMIPNNPDIMGEWGLYGGGDFQFYEETRDKIGIENIIWKDLIIYKIRPHVYGW